jgi:uncharacterized protein (TIGR02453 family)
MPTPKKAALEPAVAGPFVGFGPGALPFFAELAQNQDRAWFAEHKTIYERDVKAPLGALIEALAFAFAAHDIPLTGDARRSLFRIHRDVRFSKDKRPYKTNAGAVMTRDGMKESNGLLYVQVGGEEGSFMAAGFYASEPKELTALRFAVASRPDQWARVTRALAEAGLEFSIGQALSRIPRGFEAYAEAPIAGVLKLRHIVVRRPIAAERLASPDLVADIVEFAEQALPLLRFGWSALDRARGAA